MEFRDVVARRRMGRDYDPQRDVESSLLKSILNQALRAPSAGHTQGRDFLVLDDITSRQIFWSTTTSGPPDAWRTRMQNAPVLIVLFTDPQAYRARYAEPDKTRSVMSRPDGDEWAVPFWHVDAGMAAMTILLAAEDAGLAACFFGIPPDRRDALAAAFSVPSQLEAVGVISLGHRPEGLAPRRHPRPRRSYDESVHHRGFGPS